MTYKQSCSWLIFTYPSSASFPTTPVYVPLLCPSLVVSQRLSSLAMFACYGFTAHHSKWLDYSSFKKEPSNSHRILPVLLSSFPSSTLRAAWYLSRCDCSPVYLHLDQNSLEINTAAFSLWTQYLYLACNKCVTNIFYVFYVK